jgi:hypothetical protein
VIGGRHAAIDRLLQDDLLDVVRREAAFGEGGAHVHPELFPFVEREHGADHQDAARALVVMRARPDLAPGRARDEVLEFLREGGLLRVGAVDPGIA